MKYIVSVFIFAVVCHSFGESRETPPKTKDRITIIFNSVQQYDSIKTAFGVYLVNKPEIDYLSDFFRENRVSVDIKNRNDTITIEPLVDRLVVAVRYYSADWIYYCFHKGDTAVFSYKNNFPFCKVNNRSCGDYDMNYQYFKLKHFNQTGPHGQYYNMVMQINTNKKEYYRGRYNEILREQEYIDSLKHENILTEEYAEFHSANSRYSFLSISRSNIPDYQTLAPKIQAIASDFRNDKMLNNRNYLWFLRMFTKDNFTEHIKSHYDPRVAFDSIAQNKIFSQGVKTFLVTDYLKEICDKGSVDDISNYYKKYSELVSDSLLKSFFVYKYNINTTGYHADLNDLLLKSYDNEKTSLKHVLTQKKDCVVIIDFWASWCSPCRQQFPYLKKVEERYKKNNVSFIFLSIDKDFDLWKKACDEEGFSEIEENYIALPSKTSFIKKIGLNSIPRTIIFDKNGNLVCEDAPRPNSPLLTEMIDSYLK